MPPLRFDGMSPSHPQTLVASHPGNQNRLVHGGYTASPRELSPEAASHAEALLTLPWAEESDRPLAQGIASLTEIVGRIDHALADGRVE